MRTLLLDAFYTPPSIAEELVSQLNRNKKYPVIADFSCGPGQLLKAARQKYPNSKVIGTDIDARLIQTHRVRNPNWTVGTCDFLNPRSRSNCRALHNLKGKVALAVLNPPFTCIGGTRHYTSFNGENIASSLALSFILNALEFIKPEGEILSILPAGTITSEKDQVAWSQLSKYSSFKIIHTYHRQTFSDCYPESVVVHFKLHKKPKLEIEFEIPEYRDNKQKDYTGNVKIIRGTQQMHKLVISKSLNASTPLIHSSHLIKGVISGSKAIQNGRGPLLKGTAVLVPRVGKPDVSKVCLFNQHSEVLLSDCVIAFKTNSLNDAQNLLRLCQIHWDNLKDTYGGTCAKYTTKVKLKKFLEDKGYIVEF